MEMETTREDDKFEHGKDGMDETKAAEAYQEKKTCVSSALGDDISGINTKCNTDEITVPTTKKCMFKQVKNIYKTLKETEDLIEGLESKKIKLNLEEREKIERELLRKEIEHHGFPIIEAEDITKGAEIGKGAFGIVFKGTYKNQEVAIKELSIDKMFTSAVNVLQEINMSLAIQHERVPKFHGVCFTNYICLVYDLLKGQPLDQAVKTTLTDEKSKFNALKQTVSIVRDLHEYKLIHRDLKPANIILGFDGLVYLVDLGTCKVSSGAATLTTDTKGTSIYMPPENVVICDEGERPLKISPACDVWSLGCVISQVMSGHLPWGNTNKKIPESKIFRFFNDKKPFPIPQELRTEIQELLQPCFKYSQEERITAAELLKNMEEVERAIY